MSDDSLLSPYGDEPQVQGETCDATPKSCSTCLTTRIIRGAVAFLVIGTAGVYGAVAAKPEVAEYLSFLPGMSSERQCPIAAMFGGSSCSSSCSATSGGSTAACTGSSGCSSTSACSAASRAAMLETCSRINSQTNGDDASEIVLSETVFDVETNPAK